MKNNKSILPFEKPSAMIKTLSKKVKANDTIYPSNFISEELADRREDIYAVLNFFLDIEWYKVIEETLCQSGKHYTVAIEYDYEKKDKDSDSGLLAIVKFQREDMRWRIFNIEFPEHECEELGMTIDSGNVYFTSLIPTVEDLAWTFSRMHRSYDIQGQNLDLSLYLNEEPRAKEGYEELATSFLSSIKEINIIDWIPCDCGIHHWLQIQTHEDEDPENIHAEIKFEPDEERHWKICDIAIYDHNSEEDPTKVRSIFGIDDEDDSNAADGSKR